MIRRSDVLDIRECRAVPITEFEVREAGGKARVEGYASIFDKGYDIYGGPEAGGYTEYVQRAAFERTLGEKPDVVLLENHAGGPLARTKSGTLALATDTKGLLSRFDLDLRDPQAKSVFIKLDRGDYDEMSFAFRVKKHTWNSDETTRHLDEVSLHKGDVSIVNFGANPHTSVGLRSALKALAAEDFGPREMAELRAMGDQVEAAMARLEAARADDKPYGDVAYADPKNGKYPIDTKEHVKAAWSYINMPKNQEDYSASELAEIKDRIEAAAKKFGIDISEKNSNRDVIAVGGGMLDNRDAAPPANIVVGDKTAWARQVHALALTGGANCDPAGGPGQNPDLQPLRGFSPVEDGMEDGDTFDSDEQGPWDSLSQAVHDLIADAAGACDTGFDDLGAEGDETPYAGARSLSIVEAKKATVSPGNLSRADLFKLMRPTDAAEPFSLSDAKKIAS